MVKRVKTNTEIMDELPVGSIIRFGDEHCVYRKEFSEKVKGQWRRYRRWEQGNPLPEREDGTLQFTWGGKTGYSWVDSIARIKVEHDGTGMIGPIRSNRQNAAIVANIEAIMQEAVANPEAIGVIDRAWLEVLFNAFEEGERV